MDYMSHIHTNIHIEAHLCMYQYTHDFYTHISLRKVFGIITASCFFTTEWAVSVELCSGPAKIYIHACKFQSNKLGIAS